MARGAPAPIASGIDQRSKIDGSLGDANMQDGAFSHGKIAHGERAGKMDAEYRTFRTTSAKSIYEVQHNLGRIAGFATKVKAVNPQTQTHYSIEHYQEEKWTTNTVTVHVIQVGAGSMDGGEVTLLIGGER